MPHRSDLRTQISEPRTKLDKNLSASLQNRRDDMIVGKTQRPELGASSSYTYNHHTLHSNLDTPKRPAPTSGEGWNLQERRAQRPPLKIARTMSYSTETHTQPDNFARVSDQVYRSSFPKPENFSYLKKLGLRTILTLVPETYPEENTEFMVGNGITHIQIGMPGNKEQDSLSDPRVPDEKITAALKIILDKCNHPILIHCNKGKHRTGTVVGCLRKFQAWSPPLAIEEYRRYAGIKNRARDERKIENYGLEFCWDTAVEHGWVPTTFPVDDEEEGEVESILAIAGPACIKAQ